jgi:hypothetical protein
LVAQIERGTLAEGVRRISGPKRVEVTAEWRKLHNEKLNDLYCSPNNVQIKNGMGGACSTYGEEERCIQGLVGKPEGNNTWEDLDVDGRIILRWIFRKWDVGVGLD